MKRWAFLAGLLLGTAFAIPATAGSPLPVPRPAQPNTLAISGAHNIVEKFAPTGRSGYVLVDLDTGEVLEGHAVEETFAPASVAKIPTALYALDLLGPSHRFETRVVATGRQSGETLNGDLVLVGGGDPELDSDDLLPLVTKSLEQGFRQVNGRFLVDGSLGPRALGIDPDQPEDAAYNPALSGLNLNFNRVRVKWTAKGVNREIRVSAKANRLDPDINRIKVIISEERPALVFRHRLEEETEIWRVARTALRRPGARWLPVRQPELYAGDVFRTISETYGLSLSDPSLGTIASTGKTVARHQSRELRRILRDMLRYSTNLTAEAVGVAASEVRDRPAPYARQIAEEHNPGPGRPVSEAVRSAASGPARPKTLSESAARMNRWAARFAGFDEAQPEFVLANHSGLSTTSRISPRLMVAVLQAAALRPARSGPEHARLPGELAGLLQSYNIAAKSVPLDYRAIYIAAKTGTMDFVRGLAGYAVTPKGRRLAFAIFSNDLARRGEASRRSQRRWTGRAKVFERSLLRDWMQRYDTSG